MSKIIKYALAVATLLIACATLAFAADGDPVVATVNGQPYSSVLAAADAAQAGDTFIVVSDTSFSGVLNIKTGVNFQLPMGVTLSTVDGRIASYGNSNIYGRLLRTGDNAGSFAFYQLRNGVTNVYGQLISSESYGSAIGVYSGAPDSATINFYGGRIIGFSQSVSPSYGTINLIGGSFSPLPILDEHTRLLNGATMDSSGNVSWGGLFEVGQIVSESISWIGLFCAAIVANKLLLIFIIFVFGFVGLGLIKRIINN